MKGVRALAPLFLMIGILGVEPSFSRADPTTATVGSAKISFPQSEFDFGTVSQGTKVAHDFVVKNAGSADLVVQRVVASCGCTASSASKETIPPGDEAIISVEFDTTGFSGEKLKTVRVYSNDMENPATVLTMKGVIEPDVIVEPKRIMFGDVVRTNTDSVAREVSITVREGAKTSITGVRGFSPHVKIDEVVSTPHQRKLRVTLDPKAPLGELRDRIVVMLSGARESSINVPIFAIVKGLIQLTPSSVSFGIIEGKEPLERAVKLQNRGSAPVSVKEVTSSHPAITATLKQVRAGFDYVVQLRVDPTKVVHDLRATVDISTGSPDEPSLSLSVYGTLPPKV